MARASLPEVIACAAALLLAGCTSGSDPDVGDDPDGSKPTVCDAGDPATGGPGNGGNVTGTTTSATATTTTMTSGATATPPPETCVPGGP